MVEYNNKKPLEEEINNQPELISPLAELETAGSKRTWSQTLSVLISGVALFSDGYNIQITGESAFVIKITINCTLTSLPPRLHQHCHGKIIPQGSHYNNEDQTEQFYLDW